MYIGKMDTQGKNTAITSINRSSQAKAQAQNGKPQKKEQFDLVSLSPAGKKQSMMKQLMQQKEWLQEKKQSLLESDKDGGAEGISDTLKELDKQLEALDQEITQLNTKDDEKSDSTSDDKIGHLYDKPKSKEEKQSEQLSQITNLASGIAQTKVISLAKDHLDGRINVLKSEIQSGTGNTEQKIADVSELKSRTEQLTPQAAKQLDKIKGQLNESDAEEENESV